VSKDENKLNIILQNISNFSPIEKKGKLNAFITFKKN